MRSALENIQIFKERQSRLSELAPGSAIIVASPEEKVRNSSVHYPFRQDSNLYYLTGFEEPESVLVFRPGMTPESVLFVRIKDVDRETWDGFRFGPEAAEEHFAVQKALPISDLEKELPKLLKGVDRLYYRRFKNDVVDKIVDQSLLSLKQSLGRTGYGLLPVFDADELLGEMRVIKSEHELHNLRRAAQISAEAHNETIKYIRPGMNEREVHGFFIYQLMKSGCAREGYNGIFASGANATTLHYVYNDATLKAGDMMLIDAAGEYNYMTADITRTFPIAGEFTDAQAEVYEGVLKIQKYLIESVKPGVPFQSLHEMATHMLTDLALNLGFLTGTRADVIEAGDHKKYYPHGVGHFLGMDVHDSGLYFDKKTNEPRKIQENMVFTIEPGLYIPINDKNAGASYRGIGVRIEDNIRVTKEGHEVLTALAIKEVSDLTR